MTLPKLLKDLLDDLLPLVLELKLDLKDRDLLIDESLDLLPAIHFSESHSHVIFLSQVICLDDLRISELQGLEELLDAKILLLKLREEISRILYYILLRHLFANRGTCHNLIKHRAIWLL